MNILEDSDKEAHINMPTRETRRVHIIYWLSPIWATFLLYGISQLPLSPSSVKTLALIIIYSLFGMSVHAFYTILCREGLLIKGLIVLLTGFILYVSLSMEKPILMFAYLTIGITILLSVCGLFYINGYLLGPAKLVLLILDACFLFAPAAFLYWGFMEALADIFSFPFGP